MADPIIARYQYTEAEAVRSVKEVMKVTAPAYRLLPWLGVFVVSFGILGIVTVPRADGVWFPPVFGVLLLALPLLTSHRVKRNFRATPESDKTITWRIDAAGLGNETEGASGQFEWRMLIDVRECRDGFLLFPQPRLAHWIPKHAFASPADMEAFRELVRRSGVKHSGEALGRGERPKASKWFLRATLALLAIDVVLPFVGYFNEDLDFYFASAAATALLPLVAAGLLIAVASIFRTFRNGRVWTKLAFYAGLGGLFLAISSLQPPGS